jgi:hypothetical protein
VILAAASTFILNSIHGFKTGIARKAAKIPYPNCYASAEVAKTNKDGKIYPLLYPRIAFLCNSIQRPRLPLSPSFTEIC